MLAQRLLAVDDDEAMAELIGSVARSEGYETWTATGPSMFKTAYDVFKPDVLVIDILMPEINGLDLLRWLASREATARIVIVSGVSDAFREMSAEFARARGLDIAAKLAKPFRVAELRDLLSGLRGGDQKSARGARPRAQPLSKPA